MDSQYLFIRFNGADWSLYDHRPGKPELVMQDGSEAEMILAGLRTVRQPAWESIPLYHVSAPGNHGTWTQINPNAL